MKNLLISLSIFFTSGLFAEESPLSIAKNFGGICRDERHLGAKVVNHGQFQKSENDIRIDEITYALEELYRGNGSHLWDLFACDLKITPDLASAILFISYNYLLIYLI